MSSIRHNPFAATSAAGTLPLTRDRVAVSERREHSRWLANCDVWLLDLEGLTVLRCRADNIGEGGVQVTVPIGYGLAVGQRYEMRIIERDARDAAQTFWSGCYGTIIRTRLITDGQRHQLGVTLRFDTSQSFADRFSAGEA